MYNISTENILRCTCVRYLVVHVTDTEISCRSTELIPYLKLYCSYRKTFVITAARISEMWPVWLYNIFHISANCGLSDSTIYSSYQRNVPRPALLYIPHISALLPVWLYNIFHTSANCGLSGSTI